jgi:pyridoxamine 5'-phosphate oxidase
MTEPWDRPFDEHDLDPDPLVLFERWFEAARAQDAFEPNAMALATATTAGVPSVRMVLMKSYDKGGFTFFTNYGSRKAGELEVNPRAALLFHWPELGRQVRIEGAVARVGREETVAYARSRSRASQLSALASPQSRVVSDRAWLERRVAELARQHEGGEVPVREDWGGYRLAPAAWEFWQHRPDRLHDRFRFESGAGGGWAIERLGP